MSEPSPKLFRPWPPHIERDLRAVTWELDHVKEVVEDHHLRLSERQSHTRGLLGQLPAPLVIALLALAAWKDPVAVLKMIAVVEHVAW